MRCKNCIAIMASFVVFVSLAAEGATIVKPVATIASSEARPKDGSINGSGLSSDLLTGAPLPGSYPTHDTEPNGMWAAGSETVPYIVFDLGAEYDLVGFHVWNFNQVNFSPVGARDVSITFSNTSAVAGFGAPEVFTGPSEFAKAPEMSNYTGEDKMFATHHVAARWVRFDVLTDWGNATNRAGLSEIRFFHELFVAPVVPPVPEPGTCMLLGLGLAALTLSRRRRKAGASMPAAA